jgi:hypothetical protein
MPQNYGSNFYMAKELNISSGHEFLSAGGDSFYSSNCSRRVDIPAPNDRNITSPSSLYDHHLTFFESLRDIVPDIKPVEAAPVVRAQFSSRHYIALGMSRSPLCSRSPFFLDVRSFHPVFL